jgi:bifunctional non-homologous end joining protein LigD
MKFDGYRALAFKAGSEVRLLSRNRTLFNDNYPVLIEALKSLKPKKFIIDREIAALDQHGRPSFQLLQSYGIRKGIKLVYYAFDQLIHWSSPLQQGFCRCPPPPPPQSRQINSF